MFGAWPRPGAAPALTKVLRLAATSAPTETGVLFCRHQRHPDPPRDTRSNPPPRRRRRRLHGHRTARVVIDAATRARLPPPSVYPCGYDIVSAVGILPAVAVTMGCCRLAASASTRSRSLPEQSFECPVRPLAELVPLRCVPVVQLTRVRIAVHHLQTPKGMPEHQRRRHYHVVDLGPRRQPDCPFGAPRPPQRAISTPVPPAPVSASCLTSIPSTFATFANCVSCAVRSPMVRDRTVREQSHMSA